MAAEEADTRQGVARPSPRGENEATADGRGKTRKCKPDPLAEGLEIKPNKGREMQFVRGSRRKLFGRAAQQVFLEWFAATGNCVFSAAKAGFSHKTVWKHRMKNPRFLEAFDLALDQGIVRAKATLIEMKAREGPIRIDGDLDAVELVEPDPQIVLQVVREHERARVGFRKRGATPRVASDAEVDAALNKRLVAYSKRVRGVGSAAKSDFPTAEEAQGPLHHAAHGPPPRPGEEL